MIRLHPPALDDSPARYLRDWTAEVLKIADFTERVTFATNRFATRNKKGAATFDKVKLRLYEMCNETWRCVYCEDNYADEVEHMRPKDVYPEQCFVWENYVYACGPCNGPKNNHFAVMDAMGVEHDVTPPPPPRAPNPPVPRVPPVAGTPMLIDPRVEDPMYFLALDLASGGFAPHPLRSMAEQRRAEWMVETLGLNDRRLPKARKVMMGTFRARLKEYADERDRGATGARLSELKAEILALNHQTVLREMLDQRALYPELDAVFARLPEVTGWW